MAFDSAPFRALAEQDYYSLPLSDRASLEYYYSAHLVSAGERSSAPQDLWCQHAADIDDLLERANRLRWAEAAALRARAAAWIEQQHVSPLNGYQRARVEHMLDVMRA
jgi:hypothetical protein